MNISYLINKHRNSGIIIDTNLMILYLVGKYNPDQIKSFKRTQKYTLDDFKLLNHFIKFFKTLLTTPNILTEVSNLTFSLNKQTEKKLFISFKKLIGTLKEEYINSISASEGKVFSDFGLTDAAIPELANGNYLVLTDDFPLYHFLSGIGVSVINFNQIRSQQWQI